MLGKKDNQNFDENYYLRISPTEWEMNPDFVKALREEVIDFVINQNCQTFDGDEENDIENLPQLASYLDLHCRSISDIKDYCQAKKLRFPSEAEMLDVKKSTFNRIMSGFYDFVLRSKKIN